MSTDRRNARRADRRKFRPGLDNRLETRNLLSGATVSAAAVHHHAAVPVERLIANGGRTARVIKSDGEAFDIAVTGGGTVRAHLLKGGKVGLVVDGTSPLSELTINPVPNHAKRGQAHHFGAAYSHWTHILDIGSIVVTSGNISGILGYRTATLSGPLTVNGQGPVDRIAFYSLNPGASITVGGDLNTLDVYQTATLSGAGTGINVGRDLNWLDVANGDFSLQNGARVLVGRDMGSIAQAAKGSDSGGQGMLVAGNFGLAPGTNFTVTRYVLPLGSGAILVRGFATGLAQASPNFSSQLFAYGGRSF